MNNAGIGGITVDNDALANAASATEGDTPVDLTKIMTQTYQLAEECLNTNYYGAKQVTKALLPLLELSDSPRIVNLTSSVGILKVILIQQYIK